MENKNNSKMLK